jgi:hypothetical protein
MSIDNATPAEWDRAAKATQRQVGGDHYKRFNIQPIDFIMDNELEWCEANVVKYVTRWQYKNGIEDLRKAMHYLQLLIERENNL